MAAFTTNTGTTTSFGSSVTQFFSRGFDYLCKLGENTSRARQIEALSLMSEEELAAKGTTRKDEVLRIVGAAAFI